MLVLLRARFWPAHLLMVLAVVAAALLGVWQLHVWQAGRDAAKHDLTTDAPVPLSGVMGGDDPFPGNDLGRPVTFSGTWMGSSTLFVKDRDLHGARGFWVVTPVLVGKSAMPVVRGWAPTAQADPVSGRVSVTGWLQPSEGSGLQDDDPHDRVIPEMRIASIVQFVDADLYSAFVVQKDGTGSTEGDGGLRQVTPESIPEVSDFTGLRNLLYAFQWWIFAGFAVYVWQRWLRDQLEAEDPDAEPAEPASVP